MLWCAYLATGVWVGRTAHRAFDVQHLKDSSVNLSVIQVDVTLPQSGMNYAVFSILTSFTRAFPWLVIIFRTIPNKYNLLTIAVATSVPDLV